MMTQKTTVELAKQGNPQAIKILMNRSLQPKGITVKVGITNHCLMVIAESSTGPDQSFLMNFVRQGILSLKPDSVKRVIVQGHRAGTTYPRWREGFDVHQGSAEITPSTQLQSNTKLQPKSVPVNNGVANPNPFEKNQANLTNGKKSQRSKTPRKPAKPLHPILAFFKNLLLIILYLIVALILISIAITLKIGALFIAEQLIYNIQILGDILQGIQVTEILNILVFAILGMGFGLAVILWPNKNWGIRISSLLIILFLPIIFLTTDIIKYDQWLQEISQTEKISYTEAKQMTDNFLINRVQQPGFLGFYLHTADFPVLPMKAEEMKNIGDHQDKVTSQFANFTKIQASKIALLFAISGWGIRLFYFLIAVMAVIIHFRDALQFSNPRETR